MYKHLPVFESSLDALCFYKRTELVPVFANRKISKEDFALTKKGKKGKKEI